MRRIRPIRLISRIRIILTWLSATRRRKFLSVLLVILVLLTSIRFVFFKPKETLAADVFIKFDEGYRTTSAANDTNGTVSAGSITGAIWRTEDLCKTGKCLYFDGAGDYVSFSDNANLDMAASDAVTIELWFRTPDITTGTRTLISKEEPTGADGGYRIQMNSSGQIVFGIDNDNTSFPLYSVTSTASYDDNKWHHIAAVKNGTSSITLYIDAQSVGTTSITSTDASNDDTFYIGIYNGASDGFTGFIDEVKVLRSARTADQIKTDFLGETPSRGVSASFGPDQKWISDGLVGYWKMDESSGNASDSSGNGTTLTDVNTVTFRGGKFGNAGDFESTALEYQYAADNSALSITGSLTLAAWIRPESVTAGSYNIIAKWDGTNESYRLFQNGDEIRLELDSAGNYQETTSANLVTSTWYHIVGVYDSVNRSARIYINGIEATSSTTGTIPSSIGDDAGRFHIGAEDSTTTAANFYDGIIDDVRIYNRALSPAEVKALYDWAPGPVGWWKLDLLQDSDNIPNQETPDSSGNDNPAQLGLDSFPTSLDPTWITGKYGSAFDFDGVDDVLRVTDNDILDMPLTSLTLEAWIIRDTDTTTDSVMGKFDSTAIPSGYRLIIYDTDELAIYIDDGPDGFECYSAPGAVSTGTWHHVAGVIDRVSLSCLIYIDGVSVPTSSGGNLSLVDSLANTINFFIGRDGDGIWFDGKIDDVRIYNYARTPAQIVEDMNAGHPTPGSPVGSAVARWKFDDMSGTIAQDASDNNNDLTLSSASWSSSGKFGGAWDGTGANWLSRTDDDDFDFGATDEFSISTWFKSDIASGGNPLATEYLLTKATIAGAGTSVQGYALYANTGGQICLGIDDDTTWDPDVSVCSTSDVYDNSWHYITAIRNVTDDKLYMYVDGLRQASSSDTTTATLANSLTMYVGDRNGANDADELEGDLDELKVFRFALSPTNVLLDMNFGSIAALGGVADHDEEGFSLPNPIGWWKLDENTGTTAKDSSGNGNNSSSFTGNVSWNTGKFGSGLFFDGTDDVVQITESSTTDIGAANDSYTVSAWINTTANYTANASIFAKNDATSAYPFDLYLNSSEFACFQISDGTNSPSVCNSTALNDGKWHYITGKRDVGTDTIYIYVDGVQVNSTTDTTTATAANNDNLSIGNAGASYTGADFNGKIDDVRIYKSALTSTQIAYLYNRGKPQGWWKFDECSGTTANDSSENGNSGTINPRTSGNTSAGTCGSGVTTEMWNDGTTGKRNASLGFDDSDDNVDMGDRDIFSFGDGTNDRPFTFSAWIYDQENNTGDIISKTDIIASSNEYRFYINNGSDLTIFLASSGGNFTVTASGVTVQNAWNHIVATYDGSRSIDGINLYLNGQLLNVTRTPSGTYTAMSNTPINLSVGAVWNGTSVANVFGGLIDDVRIYTYPLNATQVKILYNEGSVRYGE